MGNTKGKVSRLSHGLKPDDVCTIEDIYDQVFQADIESLLIDFDKLATEYAEKHRFHIGYAKLCLMNDDDKRVCDATYTTHNH